MLREIDRQQICSGRVTGNIDAQGELQATQMLREAMEMTGNGYAQGE